MHNNSMIIDIAYYHPSHKADNEYFSEHSKNFSSDINRVFELADRNSRYNHDSMNESMLNMGFLAASEVLEKTHIKASQLNMLVFSSGTPQYIAPSNAIKIHFMLGASQKCTVYDLNANCAGMLVATEQIARSMRNNPNIKYALLIGSEQFNRYSRYNEAASYSNSGDSACALLLENVFNTDRGFIDSDFYTNSSNYDKILPPPKDMVRFSRETRPSFNDKLVKWNSFDLSEAFFSAKISIEEMLFKNNLSKKDIKKYFLSQFAKKNIEYVCKELDEDIEKFVFVGDEFGYTGTTSPFLAYARAVENQQLSPGDYVIFWTVGAGTTCACLLYQY